jgi:hypothetical protein
MRVNYDRVQRSILRGLDGANPIRFPPYPRTIRGNGQLFFLDEAGKAIAAEPGQADSDNYVLMTDDQRQRLVFYMIQVNDVYAFFLTGVKHGVIKASVFPTSTPELGEIEIYAAKHGKTSFPDRGALVVEIKSAWIQWPPERNPKDYILMEANVPTFDTLTDPKSRWIRNGSANKTLALVGMHVVFSVPGFPGLVWATFEHVNNAPGAPYVYRDRQAIMRGGPWRFSSQDVELEDTSVSPSRSDGYNIPRMRLDNHKDIVSLVGKTIGPSNVFRVKPWGSDDAAVSPVRNTKIISMNNQIRSRIVDGDIRKNYILIGATWFHGASAQGTSRLANSTMETFQQPSNCLQCHQSMGLDGYELGSPNGGGISHIFGPLHPLFDQH